MNRFSDQAKEGRRGTDDALGIRPGRMPGIPSGAAAKAQPRRHGPQAADRTGFSLIELLLAVFILGIGVISISALFPAGIAQQRQSVDDIIGPTVANNALSILRTKLRSADFGFLSPSPTVDGDFGWSRPALFVSDTMLGGTFVPAGSISIFDDTLTNTTDSEIPGNTSRSIVIGQHERYYPMRSLNATDPFAPKPQYVWDCMFRRFQGKILVAILVYRVTIPGGGSVSYAVADDGTGQPPLPFRLDLTSTPGGRWDANGVPVIPGTDPGTPFNLYDPNAPDQNQGWQTPAQWLLDQNNNVHRVLAGRGNSSDGPVELVRPVSSMPLLPVYFLPGTSFDDVVTTIWYIPPVDSNGLTLTPVYVTVREL